MYANNLLRKLRHPVLLPPPRAVPLSASHCMQRISGVSSGPSIPSSGVVGHHLGVPSMAPKRTPSARPLRRAYIPAPVYVPVTATLMPVAILLAHVQLHRTIAAAPTVALPVRAPPKFLAAPLVRAPAPTPVPVPATTETHPSKPVAPTSPCINSEEKHEKRFRHSTMDRAPLIDMLITRLSLEDVRQHGIPRELPDRPGSSDSRLNMS